MQSNARRDIDLQIPGQGGPGAGDVPRAAEGSVQPQSGREGQGEWRGDRRNSVGRQRPPQQGVKGGQGGGGGGECEQDELYHWTRRRYVHQSEQVEVTGAWRKFKTTPTTKFYNGNADL